MKLSIVAAEFNEPLITRMIAAAQDQASIWDCEVVSVVKVPGCYEVPLLAAHELGRCDALVVLGYIERGETQHGEVMGHVVHRSLVELELVHGKPIGIGIIGPGATPEQAEARLDGYARAAVNAAVKVARLLRND